MATNAPKSPSPEDDRSLSPPSSPPSSPSRPRKKLPSSTLTPSEIKTLLTQKIHEIGHAADTRNFDLSSPPWSTHFSPSARISTGVLTSDSATGDSLQAFLPRLERVCREVPEFKQTAKEVLVSVNRRKSWATALVNVEFEGRPSGLVRPGVARVEFAVDGHGEWRVVRWESVRGVDWGW